MCETLIAVLNNMGYLEERGIVVTVQRIVWEFPGSIRGIEILRHWRNRFRMK